MGVALCDPPAGEAPNVGGRRYVKTTGEFWNAFQIFARMARHQVLAAQFYLLEDADRPTGIRTCPDITPIIAMGDSLVTFYHRKDTYVNQFLDD